MRDITFQKSCSGSGTKGLFDVLAASCLSGCDCQMGLFIAAAPRPLSTYSTSSNNKHSINLTCLYSLSLSRLSHCVRFSLCVFCWCLTPSSLTFHAACNCSGKCCIPSVCFCLRVGFWVFIMFSVTVSLLFGSVCLWLIDGGFKHESALSDCYQKHVEYSNIS